MSLAMWLYAIDVVGELDGGFGFIAGASGVIGLLALMVAPVIIAEMDCWKAYQRGLIILAAVFSFSWLANALIPSEKALYMILGASAAQEIVANPKVQETGGKVLELINKKLEEALSDGEKASAK